MSLSRTFRCIIVLIVVTLVAGVGQTALAQYDSLARKVFSTALVSGKSYETLTELTTKVGHRLSGSTQFEKAVEWARKKMEEFALENVHLEPVIIPHWVRGSVEKASISVAGSAKRTPVSIAALGGSIGTSNGGITAEVLEVHSFEELKALESKAKGKIIFFNRPMDRSLFTTFEAYGRAVNQRGRGAIEAAKAGGVAALVRSMSTRIDNVPHTGAMNYNDSIPKIPAAAISTADAEKLSALLKQAQHVKLRLQLSCETLPDVESANVVGELKGTEKPNEVIVVGGHLDSWDKGQGAHDDGAGCVHSMEALRLLKDMGLRPKRTIRVVLFANEENGLRGGKAYAEKVRPGEKHIVAIESDAGGFTPRGFGVGDSAVYMRISTWASAFQPVGADRIVRGGGGADISELGRRGIPTISLNVDSHRYFDYHHSDSDTIDKVNERELELGAACLAVLTYMIAQEGL